MLILDARDLLTKDGDLPLEPPRLRRQSLRMARLIEYGGPVEIGAFRETLVECSKRLDQKPCPGLLWVTKTEDDRIRATCIICHKDEVLISHWKDTDWAEGPMEPYRPEDESEVPPFLH